MGVPETLSPWSSHGFKRGFGFRVVLPGAPSPARNMTPSGSCLDAMYIFVIIKSSKDAHDHFNREPAIVIGHYRQAGGYCIPTSPKPDVAIHAYIYIYIYIYIYMCVCVYIYIYI